MFITEAFYSSLVLKVIKVITTTVFLLFIKTIMTTVRAFSRVIKLLESLNNTWNFLLFYILTNICVVSVLNFLHFGGNVVILNYISLMTNDVLKNPFYAHITQLNIWLSYRQAKNFTPRYLPEKWKYVPTKEFYMNIYQQLYSQYPQTETVWVFIYRRTI